MISLHLDLDDLEWAIDHSRRRYRVRLTRRGDAITLPSPIPPDFITIVRLRGGAPIVMRAQCGLSPQPWVDTDAYADHRLLLINSSRALRGLAER